MKNKPQSTEKRRFKPFEQFKQFEQLLVKAVPEVFWDHQREYSEITEGRSQNLF
jgi:hypothetical protein